MDVIGPARHEIVVHGHRRVFVEHGPASAPGGEPPGRHRVAASAEVRQNLSFRGRGLRTYTITEAADLTGMSRKAISRRVERGSLRSVVRNGRRRIPRSELVRAGLLGEGQPQPRESDPTAPLLPRPATGGALAEMGTSEDMLATLFREVLDRFEGGVAVTPSRR